MNTILWKQPNNILALTTISDDIADVNSYALELKNNCSIHAEWDIIGTDIPWSSDDRWEHETYEWNGTEVVPNIERARDEVKRKIRRARIPMLESLDVQFMLNLENGVDNSDVIAEKQHLRNLPMIVDNLTTLDELAAVDVYQGFTEN